MKYCKCYMLMVWQGTPVDTHIVRVSVSSVQIQAPFYHQPLLVNHKPKDKIIRNSKKAMINHQTKLWHFWEKDCVWLPWSHTHNNNLDWSGIIFLLFVLSPRQNKTLSYLLYCQTQYFNLQYSKCLCVPPSNFFATILNPSVVVLEDRAFGKWLGHESGALMNKTGIGTFI
jgi:hypothetical protein